MHYCCDCEYYREDREGGGCYHRDRPQHLRSVGYLSPVCKMFNPRNQMKMEETKICKECGRELPLSHFSRNKYGPLSVCKECCNRKRLRSAESAKSEDAPSSSLEDLPDAAIVEELRRRGYTVECSKLIKL